MKIKITQLALFGTLLSLPFSAYAEDVHSGKEIHDESCLNCHIKGKTHDEAFYTRKDRKMDSLKQLQSMVRMCDAQIGTSLFDEDLEAISSYLNDTYYKFSDEKPEKKKPEVRKDM